MAVGSGWRRRRLCSFGRVDGASEPNADLQAWFFASKFQNQELDFLQMKMTMHWNFKDGDMIISKS